MGDQPSLEQAPGGAPRDPEELEAAASATAPLIAPQTTVGAVYLTVADIVRSLDFYRGMLGLEVLDHDGPEVALGAGSRRLVVLVEEPGAMPAPGTTGLYHFALLVPERPDLARWLAHAARDRVPLQGLSDHFVSEALYLADPDRHGIEIYWDRPRSVWEGRVAERMTTLPLDVDDLFSELDDPATEPFDGLPDGTVMGHVHLKVSDVESTVGFYRDVLGFALMAELGGQAAFFAAGGYHHHIGANVWESRGASQAPPGAATLRQATIVLPNRAELGRVHTRLADREDDIEEVGGEIAVRDPSGNLLRLTAAE